MISLLTQLGYSIQYHYRCGQNYSRLVIDRIAEKEYNDNSNEQVLAGREVDKIFKEVMCDDQSSERKAKTL